MPIYIFLCQQIGALLYSFLFVHLSVILLHSLSGVQVGVSFCSDIDCWGPVLRVSSCEQGAQGPFETVRHTVIQLEGLEDEWIHSSFSSGNGDLCE